MRGAPRNAKERRVSVDGVSPAPDPGGAQALAARPPDYRTIGFDAELVAGRAAYGRVVGDWWQSRAEDGPHARAYRTVVREIAAFLPAPPRTVVDYACGAGNLLARLGRRFPVARLIGIDGSPRFLDLARERVRRLGGRAAGEIELVEAELPGTALPSGEADLVVLCFPHIVPVGGEALAPALAATEWGDDAVVARALAAARKRDPKEESHEDADALCDDMLWERGIARNMHDLVQSGGVCVRVEYAEDAREQLSELSQRVAAFEEGSLAEPVDGWKAEPLFRLHRCRYFRSRVIEDVYHQTREETDRTGGYWITFLEAL